jgi:hypothetical protein
MTMTQNTFKSELLKQNGHVAVDEEVSRLHTIIQTEQRRVRRLAFWAIGVWALWILMISASIGVPRILAHISEPVTTRTAAVPAAAPHSHDPGLSAAGGVLGIIILATFLGLPIAGIALTILLIVTRRTASMNQVRASLASIDAQLRMLGAGGVKADR